MAGAQFGAFSSSQVLSPNADNATFLHQQSADLEIPAKVHIRVAQHLSVDRRDQPQTTAVSTMEARHTIAELRIDAGPSDTKGL